MSSKSKTKKPTVCLVMIVKDEAHVIERCLKSVKNLIDYWVIHDTGSSDGTPDIINRCMEGIPGELHHTTWVDFSFNRNAALDSALGKSDWIFTIDADEVAEYPENWRWSTINRSSNPKPYYMVATNFNGIEYERMQFFVNSNLMRYVGVVHEYINTDHLTLPSQHGGRMSELIVRVYHEGARAKNPDTYKNDIAILEHEVEKFHRLRDRYYLAQSYKDSGDLKNALRAYERFCSKYRMAKHSQKIWKDYFWHAQYMVGVLREELGHERIGIEYGLMDAYHFDNTRAEPLYRLGLYFIKNKLYNRAYTYWTEILKIPHPGSHRLFVESYVYDNHFKLEYMMLLVKMERYAEAMSLNNELFSFLKPEFNQNKKEENSIKSYYPFNSTTTSYTTYMIGNGDFPPRPR